MGVDGLMVNVDGQMGQRAIVDAEEAVSCFSPSELSEWD